jgi:hypothetical protein
VSATPLSLSNVCMKMMFGLMLVQFFFIPVISLSNNLVFALPVGKKHSSPWTSFLFRFNPVLFEKITSNWKVFSILSSSFSYLGFDSHSFNFFRWLIDFICFLRFHPHCFFFLGSFDKVFIILNFILQIKFMIFFNSNKFF